MQTKLKNCAIAVLVIDIIGLLLELMVVFTPNVILSQGWFPGGRDIDVAALGIPYEVLLRAVLSIIAAIFAINGISKDRKVIESQYDYPVPGDEAGDSDGTVADIIAIVLVMAVIYVCNWVFSILGSVEMSRIGAKAAGDMAFLRSVTGFIWVIPSWVTSLLILVCGIDLGRKKDPAVI
ncbi:MAG: hypothetical protein K6C99_09140 [Lachnospiraceae bacterium]|nr:hypothetical protein [Lachnospiraceae bacterium]